MHSIWLDSYRLTLVRDMGVYETPEPAWAHPDRIMETHLFLYVIEGRLTLFEEDSEYILQKGDMLFLKKGVRHWGKPVNQPGTRWYYIHFYDQPSLSDDDKQEQKPYFPLNKSTSSFPKDGYQTAIRMPKKIEASGDSHIERKLEDMLRLYRSENDLRHLFLSVHAMELFLYLLQKSETQKVSSKSDVTVRRIIEILERYGEEKVSGEIIASEMEMNYNYLNELFKRKTGIRILDYHMRVRIERAEQLLKSGKWNISEVGEKLGFANAFYFSRIFKKVTGFSPTEYLKNHYIP